MHVLSRVHVEVEVCGPPVHEAHLHPLPVAHVVPHGHVPADAKGAHPEAQAGRERREFSELQLSWLVFAYYSPDVLPVVVGAERVELDVDRVARVSILCHDGVGAHLMAILCFIIWEP